MLAEVLFFSWLAVTGAPELGASSSSTTPGPALTAEATPAPSQDQLAAALVEELAKVCAAHPEVERAFVLAQSSPDGSPTYMFIPIFDRKVSDEALNEADAAYQKLFPERGHLQLTLLARNTWKKNLGGVPPIYVRPGK